MSQYHFCHVCHDTAIAWQGPRGSMLCYAKDCRARKNFEIRTDSSGYIERMGPIPWRSPFVLGVPHGVVRVRAKSKEHYADFVDELFGLGRFQPAGRGG